MDFAAQSNLSPSTSPVDRAATGIEGLDDILSGGLPRQRLYLIQGDPGTGKTTLSLQYLLRGAQDGEKCLYISLSESRAEIIQVADSHGWDLDKIDIVEMSEDYNTLSPDAENTLFLSSEIELSEVTTRILQEIDRLQPTRVVFDSLSEWRLLSGGGLRFRRQILALKNHLSARGATVLLLDDHAATGEVDLQSLAHGVVQLHHLQPDYGAERRRLSVIKLRGSQFRGGFHDFLIRPGGLSVFPRLVATEHSEPFTPELVSSGMSGLDDLLGGGLKSGTAALVVGASGTGKSILSQCYAEQFLKSGGKVALFSFEETSDLIEGRAGRFGFDLEQYRKDGTLMLQTVDPAELSPGEFAWRVRDSVEREGTKMVILDSLNGYLYAMAQERHLMLHMHELLSYLNARGVVTLLVVCQNGLVGSGMRTPVDMSYLADSVIMLRHFESFGEVKQAVSVMKNRANRHERTIRELQFSSQGLRVGEPLRDFKGILTGVPDYVGNDGSLFDNEPSH
ncbi:circadian clock protein kinase KaiC [Abditibacteriota bacterium]|nr:circadian clock protein kinase KaiC [Abditibacteriota bacterium]